MRSKLSEIVGLVMALAAASCSSGSSEPDASTDGGVDLRPAADRPASSFCKGTSIAGTCVQSFLQTVLDCFARPPTGGCTVQGRGKVFTSCWSNGALVQSTLNADSSQHLVWKSAGGTTCMQADTAGSLHTMTASERTLVIDDGKGSATCPDGSTVSIPTGLQACADLSALFAPKCAAGTCL